MFSQERGGCEYREAKVRKDEETGWDVSSEPLSSDCFSLSESQSEVCPCPTGERGETERRSAEVRGRADAHAHEHCGRGCEAPPRCSPGAPGDLQLEHVSCNIGHVHCCHTLRNI